MLLLVFLAKNPPRSLLDVHLCSLHGFFPLLALLFSYGASSFSAILSSSSIFPPASSAIVKLTGEFTSLEEPTDDPDIVTVLTLFADISSFGSEGRIISESTTQKLRLPIVNSIFWFLSTSELLLAKSKKAIELMIPTPFIPMVGAH
jgi:hypothetical protein